MKSFNSKSRVYSFKVAFDPIGNRESHTDGGGAPVSYTANALNQHLAAGLLNHHFDTDGNLVETEAGEGRAICPGPWI